MRAFDGGSMGEVWSRTRVCVARPRAVSLRRAGSGADGGGAGIVEPTGNLKPEYSKNPDPSPRDLIETWRSANLAIEGKRSTGKVRDPRLSRRPGKNPRAFLQFQVFSAEADPPAWAARRYKGRAAPVELTGTINGAHLNARVPLGARGEGDDDLCARQTLWTAEQIEEIVNPTPLPVPPAVSRAQVVTPAAGSPERAAIMDALRPRYKSLFGAPIVFRIVKLRVAAGFGFRPRPPATAQRRRDNAAGVDQGAGQGMLPEPAGGRTRILDEEGRRRLDDRRENRHVRRNDSIVEEGDLIGAPPQLVDKDAWPEREDFPLPE